MVLTPYAETLRERARNATFEARAVLRPAPGELNPAMLDRTFTLRANDGFVEAFGPALIAAAAEQAPRVRLRFAPKPEKSDRPCAKAGSIWRLACWARWARKSACRRCFAIALSA